jgi:hypothetical protein
VELTYVLIIAVAAATDTLGVEAVLTNEAVGAIVVLGTLLETLFGPLQPLSLSEPVEAFEPLSPL